MTTVLNELVIQSGSDWSQPLTVTASDGVSPLAVTNLVMEMRRDKTYMSQMLAHLDETGQADGTITTLGVGTYKLSLSAAFTASMPWGRGFWDVFGLVAGERVQVASGVLNVRPRVTE